MTAFPDFPTFFRALWGDEIDSFPWQEMLAARTAAGRWPEVLDLPTAAGKTACIDIAIYALASQADRPVAERTSPRRIWFVVDRRIVVDEAHERARSVADKLAAATEGPLKAVADRLRYVAGTERPLATARLRGGIFRDDSWARLPSQPAVITSTVDQLGSLLLFRGYGHPLRTAPIFAGLAANDSLIFLDEAHCSVPFLQTLRAIERYRGPDWAESPIPTPFAFVVMSATPPDGLSAAEPFPGAERRQALNHPKLEKRFSTSKPAELRLVKSTRAPAANDRLVTEAAAQAQAYLGQRKCRVGVVVNRVRTAEEIAQALREAVGDQADVVLLTGRMRPFERDQLVDRWKPYLRARDPDEASRPTVVVSTQCIEVGADFSFDALVTECASLDALRQRFGRLARMGADQPAPGTILARKNDVEEGSEDPIYGEALAKSWHWLCEAATAPDGEARRVIDFGVDALDAKLESSDDWSACRAPAPVAAYLLPAHLDLLCQTAPPPALEPDISLYLHGRHGPPEVQVVWRCDLLTADDTDRGRDKWIESVALCPPSSGEMLSVPLWRLRAWLGQDDARDDPADVEGADASEPDASGGTRGKFRRCVLWRGRDRSKIARGPDDIAPGDVVVLPADYGIAGLGQSAVAQALGASQLDLWEPARVAADRPPAVRLHPAVLQPWLECPPLKELVATAAAPNWTRDEILAGIDAVLQYQPQEDGGALGPPSWWLDILRAVRGGRMEQHPAGGVVLFARQTEQLRWRAEQDLFADDDDLTSAIDRQVSLARHSRSVERTAKKLAARCLPESLSKAISSAAFWHDAGKLDPRFQLMLHEGDELAAASADVPLAKSGSIPASPARRRAIREASGLPENFRHEMLSVQLMQLFGPFSTADEIPEADLVLHLVASHHGHARPFAPVAVDEEGPPVSGDLAGVKIALDGKTRGSLPPMHRIDAGLPERFWRLTRHFGWWGLAYLEAILRLSDWYASAFVTEPGPHEETEG